METSVNKTVIELTFYPKDVQGRIIGPQKTVRGTGDQVYEAWIKGNGEGYSIKGNKKKGKGKPKTSIRASKSLAERISDNEGK